MDLQTRCRLFEVSSSLNTCEVPGAKVIKLLLERDYTECEALMDGFFPEATLRSRNCGACICARSQGRCQKKAPRSSYTAVCKYHYLHKAKVFGTEDRPFSDKTLQTWRMNENVALQAHREERRRYDILQRRMQHLAHLMQDMEWNHWFLQQDFRRLQQTAQNYYYQRWQFVHQPRTDPNLMWRDLRNNATLTEDMLQAEVSMSDAALQMFRRFRNAQERTQLAFNMWDMTHDESLFPPGQ